MDKLILKFLHQKNVLFRQVLVVAVLLAILPVTGFVIAGHNNDKRIKRIVRELIDINAGNYDFDLNSTSEGNISILENELYKTAINLRETAENSKKDKESL